MRVIVGVFDQLHARRAADRRRAGTGARLARRSQRLAQAAFRRQQIDDDAITVDEVALAHAADRA